MTEKEYFIMKRKVSPMTIITLCGVCVIFAILLSGKVDAVYILPVLGVVCVALGAAVLVQGSRSEKGLRTSDKQKAVLYVILGAFLIVLGAIQILDITFSENTWNGMMAVVLVLIITYFVIRFTRK